ncbi:hypothetical protein JG687_00019581 [Phytophthora cactorum]|uniref:HAT C-terminal dimerisation domain-containing protein n=1 Tax=Phytophthora cactorum TaxID=29920 RepID=A0A8T1TIT7_9STRA|nr:hypothetical protein JG687_00019581 [Phytophthora cactorum]
MVQRYIRIRAEIKKMEAVEELIEALDDTVMAEVRVIFDALIAGYPVMGEHMKATANIVHRAAFETGVVKVINGSLLALVKIIPPTSNIVERLFLQYKLVLTPQRRSMDSANFEQLAFLRVNRDMWDVSTVASVTKEQNE